MTTCTRFETEGLHQLENGVPLDAHFDNCDECRDQRLAYLKLSQCVADIGADLTPSPEWRARVWQELEHKTGPWPALLPVWDHEDDGGWSWLPSNGLAAVVRASVAPLVATAMLAIGVAVWLAGSPGEPALTASVRARATVRGPVHMPGDVLVLSGDTGGASRAELRVYFGNGSTELLMSCTTEPPCRRHGDAIEADYTMQRRGLYWPVLFVSDNELPESTGDPDADSATAIARGVRVVRKDSVLVGR